MNEKELDKKTEEQIGKQKEFNEEIKKQIEKDLGIPIYDLVNAAIKSLGVNDALSEMTKMIEENSNKIRNMMQPIGQQLHSFNNRFVLFHERNEELMEKIGAYKNKELDSLLDEASKRIAFGKWNDYLEAVIKEVEEHGIEQTIKKIKKALSYPDTEESTELESLKKDRSKNPFDTLPSSAMIHFTNQIINAYAVGKEVKGNKNTKISYAGKVKTGEIRITSENKSNQIALTIDNIDLLRNGNKGLKKCFAFILIQCNNQHYGNEIGFSLQDLVDNGMYASIVTARQGIKDNVERIMSLTFKGISRKGKKVIEEQGGKLIYHYRIKDNYVTLSINEKFNVEFLAQYFTVLPKYAFSLSNRAFSLIEYIFYLARQNTLSIKEHNKFNISFRAIQDYLNLPSEEETRDHTKLIRNPIEDAIEEIEIANNNILFTITPIYNENYKNIREWLDGYLEIGLKDEFAKTFIDIADKAEKQVKISQERREKALTLVEAKTIESVKKKKSEKKKSD